MVSLTDIAPSTRTVPVGGADVSVFGVSAKGIASLLSSFPQLRSVFTGGISSLKPDDLMKNAPEAIAAIIAAGCGQPGDPKAIAIAENLPVGEQAAILDVVIQLTMPDGVGPFMDALNKMLERLTFEENRGKAPVSKSDSPSKA